jgi:hypothetical protein
MCFGPSSAERAAAAESQRVQAEAAAESQRQADEAARAEAEARARQKASDISAAIESRTTRRSASGGSGRRSLFSAPGGGQGFLGRFS